MYSLKEIYFIVFAAIGVYTVFGRFVVWCFRNNIKVKKGAVKKIERELRNLKKEIEDLENK
jgi:hypothetical protein